MLAAHAVACGVWAADDAFAAHFPPRLQNWNDHDWRVLKSQPWPAGSGGWNPARRSTGKPAAAV